MLLHLHRRLQFLFQLNAACLRPASHDQELQAAIWAETWFLKNTEFWIKVISLSP